MGSDHRHGTTTTTTTCGTRDGRRAVADELATSRPWRAAGLLAAMAAAVLVLAAATGSPDTNHGLPRAGTVRTAGQLAAALDDPAGRYTADTVRDGGAASTLTRRGAAVVLDEGGTTMVWDTATGRCTTSGQGGWLAAREPARGATATLATEALGPALGALEGAGASPVARQGRKLRWARRDAAGTTTVVEVDLGASGRVRAVRSVTARAGRAADARTTTVRAALAVPDHEEAAPFPRLGCARRLGRSGR